MARAFADLLGQLMGPWADGTQKVLGALAIGLGGVLVRAVTRSVRSRAEGQESVR